MAGSTDRGVGQSERGAEDLPRPPQRAAVGRQSTSRKDGPLCSVVIAAYNCESTIGQAIASILAQTLSDFELIVVDDGSRDGTVERVERYLFDPRVRLYRQENRGPGAARNVGIERSSGALVSMLDSDDMWLPRYLEEMAEALKADPAAGFGFTRAWILEGATNRIRKRPWSPQIPATRTANELLHRLIERNFIWNSATIRREVVVDAGGYDDSYNADYSLWLRLAARGYPAVYLPGPLCIGRDSPGSMSKDIRRMVMGDLLLYEELLSSGSLSSEAAAAMRMRLESRRRSIELLDHPNRRPIRLKARSTLARWSRDWRSERARRRQPPPEVVHAFPELGWGHDEDRKKKGWPSPRFTRSEPRQGGSGEAAARGAFKAGTGSRDGEEVVGEGAIGRSAREIAQADAPGGQPHSGSLTRLVVRGASIALGGHVITQMISLATYLILARLLRPSQFGVFAAASVLLTVGLVIGESGMVAALIRRRDRVEEAFNTAFVATFAGGFALTLVCVAVSPLVGLVFDSFTVGLMSAALAGSIMLRLALIVPNARLQRNFSFMRRAILDPLGSLLFAAGAVAGSLGGLGPWALVVGTYAQFSVDVVASWALVRWRPRPSLASKAMWRELAHYGRPVFGSNIINRAGSQIPVVAVGRVLGTAALGQLSYAMRVGLQPSAAIVDVGAYSLLPAFARISDDRPRFRASLVRTVRWASVISFPVALLLIPLGTPAVVLVFGSRWLLAGHAVMALGVYCAALTFDSVASETWKAADRPDMLPRMHGLSFALTLACVAAAVPFGVTAVTVAMALSALGVASYALWGMARVTGVRVREFIDQLWPPGVAAAVMALVLYVTEHLLLHSASHGLAIGIGLLALQATLGIALYVALLSSLSPQCRREFATLLARTRRQSFALAR